MQSITDIINTAADIMTSAFGVVAGIGLVFFFFGVVKLLFDSENQEAIQKWRHATFWGLIAFTVIFSLGAIITILQNTFFR
jgi:predicted cobalt transporter CbtA